MATNQEMLSQTYVNVHNMPTSVWKTQIKRNGKTTSAIQELADCKTLALENKAAIAALTELVGQLAAGVQIDYDKIGAAVDKSIADAGVLKAGDVVSVDVNVQGK